jgi:hypothetical protein
MSLWITVGIVGIFIAIVAVSTKVILSRNRQMYPYERYNLWIQTVGATIVVSSVVLLSYQTSQIVKQFEYNIIESVYNRMASIDDIFVKDSDLYPYFYANKNLEMSDKNIQLYYRVMSTAMSMANYLESLLPKDNSKPDENHRMTIYLKDQFKISPVLREYLEERHTWFDPRLVTIMKEAKKAVAEHVAQQARILECGE